MNDRILLFDLGGVLADLASPVEAMNLAMTNDDFWAIWLNSPNVYAFETGKMSTPDFCAAIGRDLGLIDDPFEEDRLRQWKLNLFSGVENLLRSLARNYSLALLSNTNAVHWHQIVEGTQVFSRFSKIFLSYETGLYKPFPASFHDVINKLSRNPQDILFFDDSPANVSAAATTGLDSYLVKGADQLEDTLTNALIL